MDSGKVDFTNIGTCLRFKWLQSMWPKCYRTKDSTPLCIQCKGQRANHGDTNTKPHWSYIREAFVRQEHVVSVLSLPLATTCSRVYWIPDQSKKYCNPTVPHLGTETSSVSVLALITWLLACKSEISPTLNEAHHKELLSNRDGYTWILTDGSKIGESACTAAVLAPHISNKRLPVHCAVFASLCQ